MSNFLEVVMSILVLPTENLALVVSGLALVVVLVALKVVIKVLNKHERGQRS